MQILKMISHLRISLIMRRTQTEFKNIAGKWVYFLKEALNTFKIFFLSCFFFFGLEAIASDLSAILDQTTGTLEDFFQLEIVLENQSHQGNPRIVSSDDFEVQYQGQSVSSQWVNGVSSRKATFRFLLEPKRIGILQSPVIELNVNGTWQRSTSYQITVEKPKTVTDETKELPVAFVQAELLPKEVYLNQQTIYQVQFFVQSDLQVNELQLQRPSVQDLAFYELEEIKPHTKMLQGKRYLVYTNQMAMFPQSVGEKIISGGKISGKQVFGNNQFGSFSLFDAKPFRLLIPEASLKVNALPSQQQPKSFYGLVGDYSIDASLSAQQIQTGEVATLTIRIQGHGLAESIQAPDIETTPDIKMYRDKPTYQNQTNQDSIIGTAEFKVALSPSQAGSYTIAPVSLSVFNPQTKQYQTLTSSQLTLLVGGATADQTLPEAAISQKEIQQANTPQSIYHGELTQANFMEQWSAWLIWSLFILPVIAFILLESIRAYLRYLGVNAKKIRKQKALQTFQKSLKKEQTTDQAQAQWIATCIRQYTSDKLMCEASAFNSAEIQDLLLKQGLDTQLVKKVYQSMLHYEVVCYGSGTLDLNLNLLETMTQLDQALKSC